MREIWKIIKGNVASALAHPDKTVERTNREMVYGAVACTAVGMVLGFLLSPKKTTTIGSNNNKTCCLPETEESDEDDE